MKKMNTLLLLLFCTLAALQLNAQVRYLDQVFDEVQVQKDITYGRNISILRFPTIEPVDLKMDVYQPVGDTLAERPVVIYFHTGSFLPQYINGQITGGRQDSTVVEVCTRLAKAGYVAIAATYRQGWNPVSQDQDVRTGTLLQAAYRGIQDGRSCVRFLRKDVAEGSNQFRVDTSRIVAWGQGTGGYLSMGMAYLNNYEKEIAGLESEKFLGADLLPYVLLQRDGDINGEVAAPLNLPNHPGYSSDIHFAVNMGGALGDISWIDEGEAPMVSFHVATDPFAPFADGPVIVPTTGDFVVSVSGSRTATERSNNLGNNDVLAPANMEATPLNARVNAYKSIPFQFPGQTATTLGADNCYAFVTPGFRVESGPWDWWNKAILDAYIPLFNAATGRNDSADKLHNDGLITNPDMSAEKARRYIDTIMMYSLPRAYLALDLKSTLKTIDLPITFDETDVDYNLADFGGNVSAIVVDPTDANNMVGQAVKTAGAELWAGTTMGNDGLANPIPFSAIQTQMTARVWSPDAGTPIRLKAEDASNPAISVETEATTTMAGEWETLTFNFNNQVAGTAPINLANTYDKLSIFFNFGTTGADAGEKTYYWDDVQLTPAPDSTVVDIIVASPDHGILETAVIAAGLDDDLSGFGPFTVFAPTDAAFEALPDGALDALLDDPTGALAQVLLYHVLGAEVLSTDLTDGQMAATLQGGDITVTINDDGVFINNAKVTVADLRADNGVVHVIDAVLLPPAQIDLPITFDEANVNYDLVDFGGNVSAIVVDPTNPDNMVGQATKTAGAELWAGTTMGDNGLANPIPFSTSQTQMTVRVWSPDAGTPIRLKAENAANAAISVETEAVTTVAADWETLTFNFTNQAAGTAPINFANTYDKISIFFNFGTTGAQAGEKTYYWDDVAMAAPPDSTVVDIIVASPDHGILETAVIAAGLDDDLSGAGPFTVFAPTDAAFTALGQETIDAVLADQELLTNILLYHVLGAEVLSTDLTDGQMAATLQGANITVTINDDGVFINSAKVTVADLRADNGVVHVIDAVLLPPAQIDLPITFDEANVNYDLVDFGGNASAIEVDPTDANNMVGRATKTGGAELWAGTTMGGNGLANAVPFSETATSMTVRVWSPDAGTPIRLKVEDATNAAISVETEATTTVAGEWETLTFDFSNQATGTAELNLANTYDKISIFFNFGTTGADAGEKTYYWDDVLFGTTNLAILPAAQNGIKVFPNPANTEVNVEFTKALNEVVQMRLIDLSGRVLKRIETNDQISQISINDLIPGAYFLRIDSKSASYYQKIMIAR